MCRTAISNFRATKAAGMERCCGGFRVRLADEWQNVAIEIEARGASHLWIAPIETVSESEEGFERVYQGSQIMGSGPLILIPRGNGARKPFSASKARENCNLLRDQQAFRKRPFGIYPLGIALESVAARHSLNILNPVLVGALRPDGFIFQERYGASRDRNLDELISRIERKCISTRWKEEL